MQISVTEAKAQLADLVRQAEAGEDVVLTRHGRPVVHLVPIVLHPGAFARRALLEGLRGAAQKEPGS